MEKNHRFSSQNLSKGGQPTESKKSANQDVSVKWPRHSKRREQPNAGGAKPDSFRKAGPSAKARSQTNFNYDKRSKQQRPEANPPDVAASAFESADQFESEQYDGTGLAIPAGTMRHELHSVFSPGSKKQSLNHLLNFHYAPRDRDQPVRFSKTGNNRCYMTKKFSYNKEQFLQANCQFVVRFGEDYETCLATPDQLVDWSKIEQIHILSAEEPQCPICLFPPVAAKMTKCGHVYCWPCILHYLALSDKTWRKCPICYEAIHLPDLRSAVSKPFHSYALGEFVTFQLMRRQKNSMAVALVSDEAVEGPTSTWYDHKAGNNILSKLLVADSAGILSIIDREQQELDNQIVIDGMDCPENIFVQQALEQLKERREKLSNKKFSEPTELVVPAPLQPESEPPEQPTTPTVDVPGTDFLIDEDSNFLFSDIDIVPTLQCAALDCYHFYQATDGQPLYLHSLNTRMLQTMYGGLDKGPRKITGKIVQKDSCSMSEDLRKRLKYLQHLPVCTQFEVVEVEFELDTVSTEVLAQFKDELNDRKKNRQKRARAERIREKQIFEFNERQLGKSMARSAKIQIDSNKHFPSCGSVENYDFSMEPTLGTSFGTDRSASPGTSSAGPSWSKMLSTTPESSRWPSLGSGSSGNAYGPLATPAAPRLVQVTGSNMSATSARQGPRRGSSSSDEDDGDGEVERARAPEFRNDLSFAIEAALTLGKAAKSKQNPVQAGAPTANNGSKKKKNKKTLLFASGMNLN